MTHQAELRNLSKELDRLRAGISRQEHEIQQALGKALGYPWYKDDPKNFPGSTEKDGVCVGDHVAETLALEAARKISDLELAVFYANTVSGMALEELKQAKEEIVDLAHDLAIAMAERDKALIDFQKELALEKVGL